MHNIHNDLSTIYFYIFIFHNLLDNSYICSVLYLFRSSETDTPHLPAVTNRDVLELVFTLRKDSEKLPVIPRLHDYMIGNSFIPSQTSQKCLWKKVNDTENQFAQLKKNHNARCMREGSHQVEKLNNYLDNAFYGHLKSTKKQKTSHSTCVT